MRLFACWRWRKGRRIPFWSATPARSPACHRAIYGEWAVDPAGKIVVAGTPYLAGSNQGLEVGLRNLLLTTDWTCEQVIATVTANPARLLGRPIPCLKVGEPADLVIYRWSKPGNFAIRRVCVDGRWEPY